MATKLKDFYQGDTKRWRVTWPTDITGCSLRFLMKRLESQAVPDIDINAVLDAPDVDSKIFGATFEITPLMSAGLELGEYHSYHKITLANGDVGTFAVNHVSVLEDGDV